MRKVSLFCISLLLAESMGSIASPVDKANLKESTSQFTAKPRLEKSKRINIAANKKRGKGGQAGSTLTNAFSATQGQGVISQSLGRDRSGADIVYSSPWFNLDEDVCIDQDFDGTIRQTGSCSGPDVYFDNARGVYFNYNYDPYYQDYFNLQYLTQSVAGGRSNYESPFYIRANDEFYSSNPRVTATNPYYDPINQVYMNFTYDPYYMDFFNIPIYTDWDFDCQQNYYLNPFFNSDLDPLYRFYDPTDPFYMDFMCMYFNTTWDPFVLWSFYRTQNTRLDFVAWSTQVLGYRTSTQLSYANLKSFVSGSGFGSVTPVRPTPIPTPVRPTPPVVIPTPVRPTPVPTPVRPTPVPTPRPTPTPVVPSDSGYSCLNCPSECRTCQLDPIGQVNVQCLSCNNGFTYDEFNYLCYNCRAGQYYEPFFGECQSCPEFASCCTYNNGFISLCGCQSGYTIDFDNGICYQSCTAGQYYDSNFFGCLDCPSGANCCSIVNGFLTICGCVSGQSLDSVNGFCYTNCLSNQYYDTTFQSCLTCPLWSSPCNANNFGLTQVGCCCNSGFTSDEFTGNCIKTCNSNQFYDYETGSCISCGRAVSSCAGGIYVCVRGYTLDEFNNVCYRCQNNIQYYDFTQSRCVSCPTGTNCCSFENGFLTICGCSNGFTLDEINQVCYKCTSAQYYDFSTGVCISCPDFATCCNFDNGFFTLCGCQSGYTADTFNAICYRSCQSNEYYDFSFQQCVACPGQATCCRISDAGILTICGCPRGYEIDTFNAVCYLSCSIGQYYDPLLQSCISCGTGVNCCSYDVNSGFYSICGCSNGYTFDDFSAICYLSCTSLQYYDSNFGQCQNCPNFANCCSIDNNGFLTICGCQNGYTLDEVNQVCYKCTSAQYYDTFFGECVVCPGQASCCRLQNGVITICGCPRGYTLDSVNQWCYITCTQAEYYDSSQLTCVACPFFATCCTLNAGVLSICGCGNGQTIDSINNICYDTCASGSYYDATILACLTCQLNSNICDVTINGIKTQTCCCSRGYELDFTFTFCQKSCGLGQYLDQNVNDCFACPANARSCPFGLIDFCNSGFTLSVLGNVCYKCNNGQAFDEGLFACGTCPLGISCCGLFNGQLESICGCNSGYTLDEVNFVCYRCSNNAYYDSFTGVCVTCPSCATACNIDAGFLAVTGLISGFNYDNFNQVCYSCKSNEYYDSDFGVCQTCPSCARFCSYSGFGTITVTSTISNFDWNANTQTCVKSCSTTVYVPNIARCQCSGYTYDRSTLVCYKCTSVQYFDSTIGDCFNCPDFVTCCSFTNGILSVCGCQSGYTLDIESQTCYKCNSGTYWDSFFLECATCPGFANCCTYSNGVVSICGCPSGFTIDTINAVCYETCQAGEYYDPNFLFCFGCPAGATCCTFSNDVIRICGCPVGQSIDQVNQFCYDNCDTNQYYDTSVQFCLSCIPWATVCSTTSNGVSTSGCCCNQGFNLDVSGTFCFKSCSRAQYFDLNSGSCLSCPRFALTCNEFGIITCQNGYTLDLFNNVCYSCTSLQYYDFTVGSCFGCPTGASCCTYENGFVQICGCSRGYTFDEFSNFCYNCASSQYWDSNLAVCVQCPQFANCCAIDEFGFLNICGCQNGYSIDVLNGVCYSCGATEYYDNLSGVCFSCPVGSTCCTFTDGFLSICACASGFTLDAENQVCYKCANNEYYNAAFGQCSSCPECASRCFVRNGILQVSGTTRGFSYDSFNGICYTSCLANQYYDPLQLGCQSCPFCASSCTYSSDTGLFTVPRTISGYNWNATSQLCYCNDGQYLTFDSFNFKKTKVVNHKKYSSKTPKLTYAGQVGSPSTFDSEQGSTTELKQLFNGKYLYESTTTLKAGAYADKYSLYPWTYTLEANDKSNLDVTAHSMWGLNQDYCGYFEMISEQVQVNADTHMTTYAEDQNHPCGHYVIFTADSEEGEITFKHLTTGAVEKTLSAVLMFALYLLNF